MNVMELWNFSRFMSWIDLNAEKSVSFCFCRKFHEWFQRVLLQRKSWPFNFFFTWLWYRWVISARCQPFKSATEVCWWHAACPFSASHFCSGFLRHFPHKHEKLRIIGYIDLFIICHFLGGICWALLAVEVDNCRWRPASCIALFVTVLVMFIFIMDFWPGKSICFDHLSAEVN